MKGIASGEKWNRHRYIQICLYIYSYIGLRAYRNKRICSIGIIHWECFPIFPTNSQ